MEYRENSQLALASELVIHTGQNLFLTGKAGTGKTTFLHHLKKITPKRMVVVAPTGVAAINAGGVTIHSFFQLSFGPAIPGKAESGVRGDKREDFRKKFNREKIALLKCLDLLVIDEVSMVRADVLDAVDGVLRRYREAGRPFGGVQVLMIGDLHQLSPVVKEDEWRLLREYYPSPYFFDSQVLRNAPPVMIELKEIFRQTDERFIRLLNKVRENDTGPETIRELNSRYQPGFTPAEGDGFITLTTHNAQANTINQEHLASIRGKQATYKASVEGDFPPGDFPTDESLVLKVGAQVMMNRNDPSGSKQYYNGKIGRVTRLEADTVFVRSPGDDEDIEITAVTWENVKYTVDASTKEIRENIAGTFTQLPLRLAWAITIHKSQGLTFDKVIIDARAAFAYGQVYVALSRCRTFEGIVLISQVNENAIRTDALIRSYSTRSGQAEPDPKLLFSWKSGYQADLIHNLFDFSVARKTLQHLVRLVRDHGSELGPGCVKQAEALSTGAEEGIFSVSDKFRIQLQGLMTQDLLPEENQPLQDRFRKACEYFAAKLRSLYDNEMALTFEHDNRVIRKQLEDTLERLQKEFFIKMTCMRDARVGFSPQSLLRSRSTAELGFRPPRQKATADSAGLPPGEGNPALLAALRRWRSSHAREMGVADYLVLPQKALLDIAAFMPENLREMKKIRGIGKARIMVYGKELVELVSEFTGNPGDTEEPEEVYKERKARKTDTRQVSHDLYRSGKTLTEIAKERQLALTTIEGHLAVFIGRGELDINDFVNPGTLEKILAVIEANPGAGLGELKSILGDEASFADLKFARAYHLRTGNSDNA